ncbi:hypothetical protein [Sphingomonas kyeonggiensis]|uniref:Uncharacterized protein n=1 Tax=Sphingomonas kyeonggiensis TaxID=1268553 RepID=A0A7W6P044_9SPHN|nr:hypothetical protein [Sphingomonas kyeonggiensis]MBB4101481.1 hypothetical protein [Sphingomonas kyeonggiensis]
MSFLSEGQLMGLAYVISSLAALVWAFRRKAALRSRDSDRVDIDAVES